MWCTIKNPPNPVLLISSRPNGVREEKLFTPLHPTNQDNDDTLTICFFRSRRDVRFSKKATPPSVPWLPPLCLPLFAIRQPTNLTNGKKNKKTGIKAKTYNHCDVHSVHSKNAKPISQNKKITLVPLFFFKSFNKCVYHSSWLARRVHEDSFLAAHINERDGCPCVSLATQHPHQPGQPRQDAGGNAGLLYRQWRQRSEEVTRPAARSRPPARPLADWRPLNAVQCVTFRAFFYCKACHDDITDPKRIKKCGCKRRE